MELQALDYEYKMDKLKTEIHRLCDNNKWEKKYNEWELRVKDEIINNLNHKVKMLRANSKKIRAVLRLPRMAK